MNCRLRRLAFAQREYRRPLAELRIIVGGMSIGWMFDGPLRNACILALVRQQTIGQVWRRMAGLLVRPTQPLEHFGKKAYVVQDCLIFRDVQRLDRGDSYSAGCNSFHLGFGFEVL